MVLSRVVRLSPRRCPLHAGSGALIQRQRFHVTCRAAATPVEVETQEQDNQSGDALASGGRQPLEDPRPSSGRGSRKPKKAARPSVLLNAVYETEVFQLKLSRGIHVANPSLVLEFVQKFRPEEAPTLSNSASQDSTPLKEPDFERRKFVPMKWLREACRCGECMDPKTRQRKFNITQNAKGLYLSKVKPKPEGYEITWNNDHVSFYDNKWLRQNLFWDKEVNTTSSVLRRGLPQRLYFGSDLKEVPKIRYTDVVDGNGTSSAGMFEMLNSIFSRGFCLVTETPETPEATQSLLERIGPIRNTHYGGFYDFQPNLEFGDTAYTNEALDVHTDTTYFTEPAGLQAFHLLSHHPPPGAPDGTIPLGGETLLVDGFKAAEELKSKSLESYTRLKIKPIPWHASGNEDISIAPMRPFPVLESLKGNPPFRVRWNNDDRGVLHPKNFRSLETWYEAASLWTNILQKPTNVFKFQLEPGTVLIFDNWRVLHGRTAFEGARRMCGAYINRDDAISRWRMSGFPREEVIENNMRLQAPTQSEED